MRVLRVPDKRFAGLKKSVAMLAIPFLLQIVWVYITAFPVYVALSNPPLLLDSLKWSDIVGGILWILGFSCQCVADYQKNEFKTLHPDDFITTGIWKYSRYPNYFGEVTLWYGAFIVCIGAFTNSWNWVAIISPLFVTYLLVFGSGVALSETNANRRYGSRGDYIEYKRKTSTFVPWPPIQ